MSDNWIENLAKVSTPPGAKLESWEYTHPSLRDRRDNGVTEATLRITYRYAGTKKPNFHTVSVPL